MREVFARNVEQLSQRIEVTVMPAITVISFNLAMGNPKVEKDRTLKTQADFLKERRPDIVLLQEADRNKEASLRLDQPAVLGDLTEMNHGSFPEPSNVHESTGPAVLSRYPLGTIEKLEDPLAAWWWLGDFTSQARTQRTFGRTSIQVGSLSMGRALRVRFEILRFDASTTPCLWRRLQRLYALVGSRRD